MAYDPLQIEFYQNLKGINEKASNYNVQDGFFLSLRNFSFERPNAIVSRAGTTDFATFGFASFLAQPAGLIHYNYQNFGPSESFIVFDSGNKLFNLTTVPQTLNSSLTANATTSYPIDFISVKNRLYYANGQVFNHLGLTQSTPYSMPGATSFRTGGGMSFVANPGLGVTSYLPSGTYVATYAYVRAIEGLSLSLTNLNSVEVGERYPGPSFLFLNLANTLTINSPFLFLNTMRQPGNAGVLNYGISYLAIYLAFPGETFSSAYLTTPTDTNLQEWEAQFNLSNTQVEADPVQLFTLIPRFLETYKNMLFTSGYSSTPSVVWHSEFDYENILPENFIEVRTDNGDNITCLKTFQNTLIVFKLTSIHEINGDSPETLSLKDMTLEYGCVNNEAAVCYEDKLWFVSRRGICEYAGSNTFIVSEAVNETFKTLDLTKAKAFHIAKKKEVWFSFGTTTLVYDYNTKAWTIHDGFDVQFGKGSAILDYGVSTYDLSFFRSGTSHYQLVRFKDDVYTDRGNPITLIAQSPYFKRMGDSTQEMFRRFYVDADVPGSTTALTLSILSDYSSSASFVTNLFLNSFQKRIDTAVSAKSASYKWVISASDKITINGYAIHARYLRSV